MHRSEEQRDMLRKACETAGGQSILARAIGKTQGHLSKWVERGYIPAESVIAIEKATGIPRHQLRPDVYPPSEYRALLKVLNKKG